jgi:hypothetical protein
VNKLKSKQDLLILDVRLRVTVRMGAAVWRTVGTAACLYLKGLCEGSLPEGGFFVVLVPVTGHSGCT